MAAPFIIPSKPYGKNPPDPKSSLQLSFLSGPLPWALATARESNSFSFLVT